MPRPFFLRSCLPGFLSLAASIGGIASPVWSYEGPTLTVAQAAPELAAPGDLLLPLQDRVPIGLDIEALDNLGENWRPWIEETADLIADLYEGSESGADQQRAIAALRHRLATMQVAFADQRYAPIHPMLQDLQGKLVRRLDVFEALQQLLSGPQPPAGALAESGIAELQAALNELETSLLVIPQGAGWLPYVQSDDLDRLVGRGEVTDADRPLLTGIAGRIRNPQGLQPDQAEFLKQPMFVRLAAAIEKLLPAGGDYAPGIDNPLLDPIGRLIAAQEEYEQSGSRLAAAELRRALNELRSLGLPGSAQLAAVVNTHYFSHNLQLIVTESFLKPIFSDYRQESGGVNEVILEAQVTGCQWTNTIVGVDLKPCDTAARFVLNLDGDVRSRTTGEVCVATVYTSGRAKFHAEKEIVFDGQCFHLCPSRIGVNANNCTYDAETCLEWVPLARKLARNVALDAAAEKRAESEAYTRQKISREVRSRFDRETRQQFSEAEGKLQSDLYGPLAEQDLKPEVINLSSTEVDLTVRERLMRDGQLAGGTPPRIAIPEKGLVVQIHQSLLSNGVDRMGIAGERLTKKELDEKIQGRMDKIFKKRSKDSQAAPPDELAPGLGEAPAELVEPLTPSGGSADDNTKLIFDTYDPISFRFEDGAIVMSMRAGLERPGEEEIPTQVISVPLLISLEGDQVVMTRGTVGVKPAERPDNIGEQITRAQIMRKRIEDSIPERQTRDATSEIKQQGKTIPVRLTQITSDDGWLNLIAE